MEPNTAIELINHQSIDRTVKTVWADVGCGSGLFTYALSTLLMPGSKIYAVDKNADLLKRLQSPANVVVEKIKADFVQDEMNLHDLDGILMANSLHFVRDKDSFINKMSNYLKSSGCFLIVEYDTNRPNPWVPFPLDYLSLKQLFEHHDYASIQKIHEVPSMYNRANIYSVLIKMKKTG